MGDRASLPVAMMVMIAVNFGAVLGLVGWPVLQAFGVVNKPAVEVAQQNQAELISRLDATVADLSARVASTSDKQEAASQFMAEIDARFIAVRRSMRELRDAQNAVTEHRWRNSTPLPRRRAAISCGCVRRSTSSRRCVTRRRPRSARGSTGSSRRWSSPDCPGRCAGKVQATVERPRSLASAARSAAANEHVFNLKVAQ